MRRREREKRHREQEDVDTSDEDRDSRGSSPPLRERDPERSPPPKQYTRSPTREEKRRSGERRALSPAARRETGHENKAANGSRCVLTGWYPLYIASCSSSVWRCWAIETSLWQSVHRKLCSFLLSLIFIAYHITRSVCFSGDWNTWFYMPDCLLAWLQSSCILYNTWEATVSVTLQLKILI